MSRLQLFVLAYNLGNFFRQAALPKDVRHWTMTTLREKLIKIGAKVVLSCQIRDLPDGRGRDIEGVIRLPSLEGYSDSGYSKQHPGNRSEM